MADCEVRVLFDSIGSAVHVTTQPNLNLPDFRDNSNHLDSVHPALQGPDASPEWTEIGTIVGAQGLKGEVKVYPDSDFPARFEQPGQRWLLPPGASEPQAVELLRGRYLQNKGLYVVQFAEVVSRTQAETLRGYGLVVPASDRPPLEAGEFHVLDLVGLEVFNQQTQAVVGSVTGVLSAGNDLLEVKTKPPYQGTVLIPFVKEIVPVVDLKNKRVEITPPLGLLESSDSR